MKLILACSNPIRKLKYGVRFMLLTIVFGYVGSVFSAEQIYEFSNTEQESIYQSLVNDLRCLVCQNQNLAGSKAELAGDLRKKTWEMVIAGASEAEVIKFMTTRYGDFVLYRPPFKLATGLLWLGPFLLLAAGVVVLLRLIRRRQGPPGYSAGDHERARALLEGRDTVK